MSVLRLFIVLACIGITSFIVKGVPKPLSSKIGHPLDAPRVLVHGRVTLNRKPIQCKESGSLYIQFDPIGNEWNCFNLSEDGKMEKHRPSFNVWTDQGPQLSYKILIPPGCYRVSIYLVDKYKWPGGGDWPCGHASDRLHHAYSFENTPLTFRIDAHKNHRLDIDLKAQQEKPLR